MSKNSDRRLPSVKNNTQLYINQKNQITQLAMNSKISPSIDHCIENESNLQSQNGQPFSPIGNSQTDINKRIQMKIKNKRLSGQGYRKVSEKTTSNPYLSNLNSNSTIEKDKSINKQKTFVMSLQSLNKKVEEMFQNSDKINELMTKYQQKSDKFNILRIRQLVWKDLSMLLCQYCKKVNDQQNIKYQQRVSSQIILQALIIKRIHRVCQKQQIIEKCIVNERQIENMLNKRLKQLQTLKIR